MLKHKYGIHEAYTEPLPNFPEAIECFNFLILSPIKKIRQIKCEITFMCRYRMRIILFNFL